jgi:hypothetical protein
LKYVCLGESDDDREELYKAANAALNASSVYLNLLPPFNISYISPLCFSFFSALCLTSLLPFFMQDLASGPFWSKMEYIFASISLDDASFVKQQVGLKHSIFFWKCKVTVEFSIW